MEIYVAVKPVPEAEARLRASPDGTALDPDGVKFVLAGYDESAVEQALLLKEANAPSTVHAISLGPPARSEEVLRAAIALGCDRATCVDVGSGGSLADPLAVARGLAHALRGRKVDLLLFGKQAGDDEEGLVGAAVAELLGLPFFGFVTDLRTEGGGTKLKFRRSVEQGDELWEAPAPIAVALQQAWNDPRTAKLPAILKSRKATIEHVDGAAVPPGSAPSVGASFALPPARTGAKMLEYQNPEDAARKLVKVLREEAKVFP